MSILYNAIAKTELQKRVRELIEPKKPPSADPVLGQPPEIVYRWNTFGKKHGTLIENIMTKVIQQHAGWKAANQTHFKFDANKPKKLIDRIAINHPNDVAIFVECKRNLGNVSGPYLDKIRSYDSWCRSKSKEIARELGLNPANALVRFVVFNAYGKGNDRQIIRGIPVLLPENLPSIFGLPVLEAFYEFHNLVRSTIIEHHAFRELPEICAQMEDISLAQVDITESQVEETSAQFRARIEETLAGLTAS